MKIYTKTGDSGTTSLANGERVKKYHLRIQTYGTVDELNSHIGFIRSLGIEHKHKKQLLEIQKVLMQCASVLACSKKENDIKTSYIKDLENVIDELQPELDDLETFIIPGGSTPASAAHIARCVCRRAERAVVLLATEQQISINVLKYLNRLSDYLFVLARYLNEDNEELYYPSVS
jgi:cob(I)alamin adenosyltransferase